jgi:acyl carrier protein
MNHYGPTESTVGVTTWELGNEEVEVEKAGGAPLGRPLGDSAAYVAGAQRELTPAGVPGELYIGGGQLARGYMNSPGLTAERFVPDAYGAEPGGRLYRTGDRVRWRADGKLEFLGRLDKQVKLRGYRIELGEVEAVLSRQAGVAQCAVVVREDHPGDRRLVACVVSGDEGEVNVRELRAQLQSLLPEYMAPTAFVVMEKLPLTSNGKLDRRALPEPDMAGGNLESHSTPRTPVEEIVTGIWEQVLRVDRVGIHDNFFELGGHSLLATQVVSRLRNAFGVEIPLIKLFEAPTVAEIAREIGHALQEGMGTAASPIIKVSRDQPLPLSFAQYRLWFIDQLEPGNIDYNSSFALRLSGSIDLRSLRGSLNEIVRRHEVLRTTFPAADGVPVQRIHPASEVPLPLVDLSSLPAVDSERNARRIVEIEAQIAFDLITGPLLRVRLLRLSPTDHILQLTMHHIVCDAWSIGVLVQEFRTIYEALKENRPSRLPELPIQYADFAAWQRLSLQGKHLEDQLGYWRRQLKDIKDSRLPEDFQRLPGRRHRGGWVPLDISAESTAQLRNICHQEGVTLFTVLAAALQVVLSYHTRENDVVIGVDIANRTHVEIEYLIGFFVNQLVLRSNLADSQSFCDLLSRVSRTSIEAYAHQDLPFEKLVEELAPERELGRSPLFQVKLMLNNVPKTEMHLPELRCEWFGVSYQGSKRDLSLMIEERSGRLAGGFVYNEAIFEVSRIALMKSQLNVALAAVIENKAIYLDQLREVMRRIEEEHYESCESQLRSAITERWDLISELQKQQQYKEQVGV